MPEVGKQRGEKQAHGVVRLSREKGLAKAEGDEGDDAEINQLGDQLRLAVTAFEYFGQFERDHHGIDHQEGQQLEPAGRRQQAKAETETETETEHHHDRNREDQIL